MTEEAIDIGLTNVPLTITDRSLSGESLVSVNVDCHADVSNSEILSEGEFRTLALACFLADIHELPHHAGIIIDDPVSSLDHLRCVNVAKRLVAEAKHRQVIIFTHNLCFYHEVVTIAGEQAVPLHPVYIRRKGDSNGHAYSGEEPWIAKKVNQRLQHLEKHLAEISKITDTESDNYRREVRTFYGDLRDTWERFVEEILLGNVISRFGVAVKTQSLHQAHIEDCDYKTIYTSMARVSEWCHDRSMGRQATRPTVDQMRKEISELRDYEKKTRSRNGEISKQRKSLTDPPAAAIA